MCSKIGLIIYLEQKFVKLFVNFLTFRLQSSYRPSTNPTSPSRASCVRWEAAKESRVCFSVYEMGRFLPGRVAADFGVEYTNVVIFGTATIVEDIQEKNASSSYFSRNIFLMCKQERTISQLQSAILPDRPSTKSRFSNGAAKSILRSLIFLVLFAMGRRIRRLPSQASLAQFQQRMVSRSNVEATIAGS